MSLRKNSIMMVLYEVLSLFIPLIITPYISRVLGADGVGLYSYTYSIATYFVIVVQLGIKLYGRREIAKVNDSKVAYSNKFQELFIIEVVMFVIVSLFYIAFLVIFVDAKNIQWALAIQYIEIIVGLLDISWLYFGLEKFKSIVIRNVVVRLGEIVGVFTLLHNADDVFKYIWIMTICNLAGVVSMWFGISKIITWSKMEWQAVKRHIMPLIKLFIPVLSTTLFSIVDKTIIGAYINSTEVGYYENAYKIAKIPVVVVTALGNVALPRVTKLIADGKEDESKGFIEKSMSFIMCITVAISFGMFSIADIFIPLYLGEGFFKSIILFEILAFMMIFIGWGNVLRTQYMLPKGYDTLYTKSVIYAALINILLSIVTVRVIGAIGVAFASVCSEAIICIYSTIKIKDELPIGSMLKANWYYVLQGTLMAFVVITLGHFLSGRLPNVLVLILQICCGGIFYMLSTVAKERLTGVYIIIPEIKSIKNLLLNKIKRNK